MSNYTKEDYEVAIKELINDGKISDEVEEWCKNDEPASEYDLIWLDIAYDDMFGEDTNIPNHTIH